jgi:glucose/arabinose dehydrogenase
VSKLLAASRICLSAVAAALVIVQSAAASATGLEVEVLTDFQEPWAMAFLPDGRMLVTEKQGRLLLVNADGKTHEAVLGVPEVDYGGQGGLGDVALHPAFADNGFVYISYAEAGKGDTRGAAVARGVLDTSVAPPRLTRLEVIWRQYPKMLGRGHYGHRILFDASGHLWISSGERQKFTPSQDMQSNLGKLIRLKDDGSIPEDNPFVNYREQDPQVDDEGVYGQVWSLGHRNPLGVAIDLQGRLWVIEMGPAGGDELNLVERGANYGYPVVSNGDHYDGREIPDHGTREGFVAPLVTWTPVISPAHIMVYRGDLFADWRGDALAAGLSSEGIVRIALGEDGAEEVARYPLDARIRSIVEGPDGALWVLEDERYDSKGRLLRLTPAP